MYLKCCYWEVNDIELFLSAQSTHSCAERRDATEGCWAFFVIHCFGALWGKQALGGFASQCFTLPYASHAMVMAQGGTAGAWIIPDTRHLPKRTKQNHRATHALWEFKLSCLFCRWQEVVHQMLCRKLVSSCCVVNCVVFFFFFFLKQTTLIWYTFRNLWSLWLICYHSVGKSYEGNSQIQQIITRGQQSMPLSLNSPVSSAWDTSVDRFNEVLKWQEIMYGSFVVTQRRPLLNCMKAFAFRRHHCIAWVHEGREETLRVVQEQCPDSHCRSPLDSRPAKSLCFLTAIKCFICLFVVSSSVLWYCHQRLQ